MYQRGHHSTTAHSDWYLSLLMLTSHHCVSEAFIPDIQPAAAVVIHSVHACKGDPWLGLHPAPAPSGECSHWESKISHPLFSPTQTIKGSRSLPKTYTGFGTMLLDWIGLEERPEAGRT